MDVVPPKPSTPVVKVQVPNAEHGKLSGQSGTYMKIQDSADRIKIKNDE